MTSENRMEMEHTMKSLLAYAAPTIGVMVFVSIYTMVDGIFVARYVNETALSAINIFLPVFALTFAISLMLGTGGNAIIAKKMGENKYEEARSNFTFIVSCGGIIGLFIMGFGLVWIRPLVELLGAGSNDQLFDYTMTYARIMLIVSPLLIIQMMFENFFVTAGKPKLSLVITLIGGSANIVLDYLFIYEFHMGIEGAAIATAIGIIIPATFGPLYFLFTRQTNLYFTKPNIDWMVLRNSCLNGSSEMITNLSLSVVTFAFNRLMIQYLGVEGVAAVTIIFYLMMLLTPIYIGYSSGIAPIISYNYGSNNRKQLKRVLTSSIWFVGITSMAIFSLSYIFGPFLIRFMVNEASGTYEIAVQGLRIFCFGFLFMGFNLFCSMLFTALSNGKVSAFISLLRTLIFVLVALLVLPRILGVNGIWLAIPLAEFLTIIVCYLCLYRYRNVYHYY